MSFAGALHNLKASALSYLNWNEHQNKKGKGKTKRKRSSKSKEQDLCKTACEDENTKSRHRSSTTQSKSAQQKSSQDDGRKRRSIFLQVFRHKDETENCKTACEDGNVKTKRKSVSRVQKKDTDNQEKTALPIPVREKKNEMDQEKTALPIPVNERKERPPVQRPRFTAPPQLREVDENDPNMVTIAAIKGAEGFQPKNQEKKTEFSRPENQKIVKATDPNYETLQGLNNADTFANVAAVDEVKKAPTPKKEEENEYECAGALDADINPKDLEAAPAPPQLPPINDPQPRGRKPLEEFAL